MRAYLLAQALRPGLNAGLEASLNLCLKRLLASSTPQQQRLCLPQAAEPLVSILVPMHEQLLATAACLSAIADHSGDLAYEVLVLNDASSDRTRQTLERMEGLRLINQPRNLGFLHNCNAGAQGARGRYLVWLNNDTLVQPGWLDALVEMAERNPSVGAVGAQLRYPDGRLQEVGGIVWRDGSAARVGDGQWPDPQLTIRPRDVDYCSAAALLVRRNLWQKLGGFDPRYAPAYYEDTDLCIRIREAGKRVVVQPKALVVHFEGLSHGRDISQGVKAHQQLNQAIFVARWSEVLQREHQSPNQHYLWAMDRAQGRPMVLVADHKLPEPDRDAGSRSILHLMRGLLRAGALVAFWPHNPALPEPYREQLEAEGVLLLADGEGCLDLAAWVREQRPVLDWLLLSRPDVAEAVLSAIGPQPGLRLAYYGHDLHYRRLQRQARFHSNQAIAKQASSLLEQEQRIWSQMDLILYPAADEVAEVDQWINANHVQAVSRQIPVYAYTEAELSAAGRAETKKLLLPRILFVAGFAHPPNIESAQWFLKAVWPLIASRLESAELLMVGSNPCERVRRLIGEFSSAHAIQSHWNVDDEQLSQIYSKSNIAVAPIIYGAGVNGKIIEALRHGLPCVTTPQGARGLRDSTGGILVASGEQEFASACIKLLTHRELRWKMAGDAMASAKANFSQDALEQSLAPFFSPDRIAQPHSYRSKQDPA